MFRVKQIEREREKEINKYNEDEQQQQKPANMCPRINMYKNTPMCCTI
jgi:hypothetical protein